MANPPPKPGAGKFYRVHVHDYADQGRWLEQADFAKRPLPDELDAGRLPVLNGRAGGWFEIRVCVVQGGEEHYLYARTEQRPDTRLRRPPATGLLDLPEAVAQLASYMPGTGDSERK